MFESCGSGQATFALDKDQVQFIIGIDPSEGQINQAKQKATNNPNGNKFDFCIGTDDKLVSVVNERIKQNPKLYSNIFSRGNCEGQFDIITVAQSLHWFNFESFFQQVDTLLAPGGIFAGWTYSLNRFGGSCGEAATSTLDKFYREKMWDGGYWPQQRKHVDDEYKSIQAFVPYPNNFKRITIDYRKEMPLSFYMSYVQTWSAIELYGKKNGEQAKSELIKQFSDELKQAFKLKDEEVDTTMLPVVWNIQILLTKKPEL